MCIQTEQPMIAFDRSNYPTNKELEAESKEFAISRNCRWFTTRFFNRRTLSGDRARFIFVDEDRYGIVWPNVSFFVFGHVVFFYALTQLAKYRIYGAAVYSWFFGYLTSMGITAGAHRLWSHKSYKATVSFRILLAALFTATGENDIYTWVRDHRLHHKYTETDADPHNSRRGMFFAHVGWLLTKKHPDIFLKGRTIDNSDLLRDPVVYWNKKLYVIWYLLLRIYIPSLIPMIWYEQEFRVCVLGTITQYILNLHSTWFVNSAAHMFGDRPYNSKIQPRENYWVALFGVNEGFHNYHHQFPWDYRVAEFGITWWDPAKWFINTAAYFGFAYDLKTASNELITTCKTKSAPIQQLKEKIIAENANNNKEEFIIDAKEAKIKIDNTEYTFYVHDHPYFVPHAYCEESTSSTSF